MKIETSTRRLENITYFYHLFLREMTTIVNIKRIAKYHCSTEPMSLEETEFVCSDCGEKAPLPIHCNEPMKVVIK